MARHKGAANEANRKRRFPEAITAAPLGGNWKTKTWLDSSRKTQQSSCKTFKEMAIIGNRDAPGRRAGKTGREDGRVSRSISSRRRICSAHPKRIATIKRSERQRKGSYGVNGEPLTGIAVASPIVAGHQHKKLTNKKKRGKKMLQMKMTKVKLATVIKHSNSVGKKISK